MQLSNESFEDFVLYKVLSGDLTPKVTDSNGYMPIIACLESEPLEYLFNRLKNCEGNATIYSLSDEGKVRVTGVVAADSALTIDPTDLTGTPPSKYASIGLFLDYVASQSDGVLMPSILTNVRIIKSYGTTSLVPV